MTIDTNYSLPIFNIFGSNTTPQGTDASSLPMCDVFSADSDTYSYVPGLPELLGGNSDFSGSSIQAPAGWFNFSTLKMPDFSNMKFSFSFKPVSSGSTSGTSSSSSSSKTSYTNYNIDNGAVKNLSWWKAQGYNEEKGKQLAANTKRHSDDLRSRGITGQCGKGVRLGLNDTYYNGATHSYYDGKQYSTGFGYAKTVGSVLAHEPHLKKINVQGMHLSKEDIPAGAIVIYDAGYSSGSNRNIGHIEVSLGDGHGASDFTSTLLQNYGVRKEPKEIWIPV